MSSAATSSAQSQKLSSRAVARAILGKLSLDEFQVLVWAPLRPLFHPLHLVWAPPPFLHPPHSMSWVLGAVHMSYRLLFCHLRDDICGIVFPSSPSSFILFYLIEHFSPMLPKRNTQKRKETVVELPHGALQTTFALDNPPDPAPTHQLIPQKAAPAPEINKNNPPNTIATGLNPSGQAILNPQHQSSAVFANPQSDNKE
ncbi:hypothetical protein BYT27DRAFT_7210248 [Phlegmacium glaucopus]|nr:hypothetical protein BYT27DRAFT_7210248 [Phlegmacium glaucopus]